MQSSNLIKDGASSLGIHRNDADVFRPRQSEGGIKVERSQRFYYGDTGHETADLIAYDSAIQAEKRADANHGRIELLKRDIADIKRDLKQNITTLRRLELDKDLAKAARALARLVHFDLHASKQAVSRYVTLHNFETRRPYQQKQYERAKREYENQLRLANVCPKCYEPIKTERLQVVDIIANETLQNCSVERAEKIMKYLALRTWRSLRKDGLQKRKLRYRHVKITTLEIGKVILHYRAFQYTNKLGKVKLYYGLVDGSTLNGKLLPFAAKRLQGPRITERDIYVSIPDNIRGSMPAESYNVRDLRCECKDF